MRRRDGTTPTPACRAVARASCRPPTYTSYIHTPWGPSSKGVWALACRSGPDPTPGDCFDARAGGWASQMGLARVGGTAGLGRGMGAAGAAPGRAPATSARRHGRESSDTTGKRRQRELLSRRAPSRDDSGLGGRREKARACHPCRTPEERSSGARHACSRACPDVGVGTVGCPWPAPIIRDSCTLQ